MWFIVYWACLASAAVYILAHFVVDIWCAVLPNRDFSFNPLMQQHIKLIVKPRPFRCNNNTIKITLRIYCKWKLAILIVLFCFLHSGLLLYKTFICKCVLIREHAITSTHAFRQYPHSSYSSKETTFYYVCIYCHGASWIMRNCTANSAVLTGALPHWRCTPDWYLVHSSRDAVKVHAVNCKNGTSQHDNSPFCRSCFVSCRFYSIAWNEGGWFGWSCYCRQHQQCAV